ncbi:hypothetical protein [Algibacillus agarilyticus]|uniref:hypothetical protein n=1 Tax=Algibacillus agarilyticus TaxID=2234133 RepID=UPI000DD0CA00|nr:hypothetical protein [Algibacillus agarilyticus]
MFTLNSTESVAKQLSFSKKQQGEQVILAYKWIDHYENEMQLEASFLQKEFNAPFRLFKKYKPEIALRHIEMGLRKKIRSMSQRGAQVRIKKFQDNIEIIVKGKNKNLIEKVKRKALTTKFEIEQNYLLDTYYTLFVNTYGQTSIKPDHVRFAQESMSMLSPLNEHIVDHYSQYPIRSIVNYVLGFIQSIPYADLEDRQLTHGSGFSPPNRLLLENRGDCDSKTVLMAALMRGVFPRLGISIILLPKHALLGIQIPHQKTDDYVEIDGAFYVLMEPTGPAMLPVATIADSSKKYIQNNAFSHQLIPVR